MMNIVAPHIFYVCTQGTDVGWHGARDNSPISFGLEAMGQVSSDYCCVPNSEHGVTTFTVQCLHMVSRAVSTPVRLSLGQSIRRAPDGEHTSRSRDSAMLCNPGTSLLFPTFTTSQIGEGSTAGDAAGATW